MVKDGASSALREQGAAVLIFLGIAILSVLGIVILAQFQESIPQVKDTGLNSTNTQVNATIGLFIAAIAIFGTFATVTALIVATKAIIGIVKGLR